MATKEDKAQLGDFLAKWERERGDRKAKAKEDLFLLLDQQPNITGIDVYFDGCGDSGQVEGIEYLSGNANAIVRNEDLDMFCLSRNWTFLRSWLNNHDRRNFHEQQHASSFFPSGESCHLA